MAKETYISALVIILGFGASTLALEKDLPLKVSVVTIGTDFVVFSIEGSDTVNNLPVKSVGVNYTKTGIHWSQPPFERSNQTSHTASRVEFEREINVTGLDTGSSYLFQFYAINTKNEHGPLGPSFPVLLLPETPDFSITHRGADTVRLFWGYPNEKLVDYFLLTIEKVTGGRKNGHLLI